MEFGFAALSYFCVVQTTNAQRRVMEVGGGGVGVGHRVCGQAKHANNEVGCEGQF